MMNQLVSLTLLFIGVYLVFSYIIKDRIFFWTVLLCLKIFAGVALGLIYDTYYQGGDTWNYHHDALLLMDNPLQQEMEIMRFQDEPRALFFSRIVACFHWLTNGNYWISGVYLSFLSFLGLFYFIQNLASINHHYFLPSFVSVLAFPSIVFWSSGVMKESLVIPSFLIVLAVLFKINHDRTLKNRDLVLLALSMLLLAVIKYYILGLLVLAFIPFFVEKYIPPHSKVSLKWLKVSVLTLFIWLVFLYVGPVLHPNFSSEHLLPNLLASYQQNSEATSGSMKVEFVDLDANWLSILQNAPRAVFGGIFRPFPWETNTTFQFIVAIENVLIAVLFLIFLVNIKYFKPSIFHLSMLLFILMSSVFFTIGSPNLGTLSRIRVTYLIPLIFILTSLIIKNIDKYVYLVRRRGKL